MKLTAYERSTTPCIGVAHYGETKIAGPLTACAIIVDYEKVTPALVDAVLAQNLTEAVSKDMVASLIVFGSFLVPAKTLNAISNIETACHHADYSATLEAVFNSFKILRADPGLIVSKIPLKEVVKNEDVALYTGNEASEYIVQDKWNQLTNLIPSIKFKVEPEDTFTMLFARAVAKRYWDVSMSEIKKQYPDYNFDLETLTPEEEQKLQEKGMTIQHRYFLPQMNKFSFAQNILI